ncbi:hypothetical protein [Ellagibacter isourolithinifaciens]|uniref:hypothetical protein n=1 Tax=Ellagibacter isourolithinifaciens TaxID=2137581 RepID=UPI003A8FB4CA
MICVVVQTVIFGFGNVITKFAYESVTPLWCMVLRFGLALTVFALAFGPRMVRELRGAKLADWAPAAACLAVGYIACNLALDVTTATNAGFLVALFPWCLPRSLPRLYAACATPARCFPSRWR